jgi:hypothetical protein
MVGRAWYLGAVPRLLAVELGVARQLSPLLLLQSRLTSCFLFYFLSVILTSKLAFLLCF